MNEAQIYPENIIDFLNQYSFADKDQHYTNGCRLIPVFRVAEALEHYFPEHFEVEPAEPDGGPHFTWIKDADEMFRAQGYLWEDTLENGRVYENADTEDAVKVTKEDAEFYCMDGGYHFWVPAKLILATARLIEEMEGQK